VVPTIEVTAAAVAALRKSKDDSDAPHLRLQIDGAFRHNLNFDNRKDGDVEVRLADDLLVVIDPMSSRRAEGLHLDYVDGPSGSGFKIDNPNAPAKVQAMTVRELKSLLDAGEALQLIDVRSPEERSMASIAGSRLYDEDFGGEIERLPKGSRLVFFCHTGRRSQAAAEYFLRKGFTDVHNLAGGIDAWSREIDSSIPRY